MNNYEENKNEIIQYINLYESGSYPDIKKYITCDNSFYSLFNCNIYTYLRVSTEEQDFGRQLIELYNFLKKKNVSLPLNNVYFDKFTGKKITREQYQELKKHLKSGDYLLFSNLSRLGRNWDDVKKEWYEMEIKNINRIVLDNENLSVELPTEEKKTFTLERKMIQDITFSACLYASCRKVLEVCETTKSGMQKAKEEGKKIGRPAGKHSTEENFKKVLSIIVKNGYSQKEACEFYKFPYRTFQQRLYKIYDKYNVKTSKEALEFIEMESKK